MLELNKVIIIAEAGVNHNGELQKAKDLIDAAADAGVDFVKFQTFKADDLVSKLAKQADYQKRNIGSEDDSQYQMLKKLELSDADHDELIQYSAEKGVRFFSTAFDVKGLNYLNNLGFDLFKIPSGEITNYPYLKRLAEIGKPVILSTGMANLQEIKDALYVLEKGIDRKDITVLHCTTEYPTPMQEVNLKAMQHIKNECDVQVGYSDHTLGIEVPIAAVALGARVIEKHFTLDRNLPGPDHRASLEPNELKAMVASIRNIEKAISGSGVKEPSRSELNNLFKGRKSIHLRTDMSDGEVIIPESIVPLRPGDGISSMQWSDVLGKRVNKDLKKGYMLSWKDIDKT